MIFDAEGGSHMETFARGAFTISTPHSVKLRVNHNDRSAIPCSLVLSINRDGLDYVASLPDSPQSRALLARADEICGASIECVHEETHPDSALRAGDIVVTRAKLLAVSITVGDRRPAWFDTSCVVTRVN
jgi:phage head maturation protease